MKALSRFIIPVFFTIMALLGCSSGDGSDNGGNNGTGQQFTNGGVTLNASTSTSGGTSTTTVTDSNGTTVLTLTITTTTATLNFPGQGDTVINFRQALAGLPTEYGAQRMAIFVAGPVTLDPGALVLPDSPGCDWFPDTQCTLGCCSDHDKCYQANNCGASSWLPFVGSAACDNCNDVAYDCIGAACAGVTESFTENNCFDHACSQFYDCPPNRDNCDCASPCVGTPVTCGDGVCDGDETAANCATDCAAGNSPSQCCVDSGNCPSETETTCPGSCCCCGVGFTCDANSLCN